MATPDVLKFPSDLLIKNTKKDFLKFSFYKKTKTSPNVVDNPTANMVRNDRIKPDIYLPLTPDIFREVLSASYATEELGLLGKFLYDKAGQIGTTPNAITQVMKEAVSLETVKNVLESWAATVATTSDLEGVRSAAYSAGYAYNPNITLFFNGTQQNYRYFRLGWTLFPRNEEEASQLLQIEKTLLKYALPGTVNKGLTANFNYNNHYTYPYEIVTTIFIDHKEFTKFKLLPSYMIYVDISHQDNQQQNEMSFVKGENSEKIYYSGTTISIGLQEKEVYIREYVDQTKPIISLL